MAQNSNPRRYYIDHGDSQPVVRAVPVRPAAREATPIESPATHQVASAHISPARALAARARRAPKSVSRFVHNARKNAEYPQR
jgi:hypothetical protein